MSARRSRFLSFFPPPEYLSMPAVGINISDHSIKMVELLNNKSSFILGNYETLPINKGSVEGGKILDYQYICEKLKELKNKFKFKYVRVSVPEEEGYVFSILLPKTEEKNISSMIEFKISDNVPLSTSEAIYDYAILSNNEKGIHVNVTVLPRTTVESYLAMYKEAGLTILSLEIEAQTIVRSIVDVYSNETLIVIDIGRIRTGIAVVEKQIVRHTSTIGVGGDSITSLISKGRNISYEDAEAVKMVSGVIPYEYDSNTASKLNTFMSSLAHDIAQQIEFWNSRSNTRSVLSYPISRVILCGGNATVPGIREAIAGEIGLPVTIGNVWRNVFSLEEVIPPIDFNHSLGYASAIGLALMG